MVKSASKSTHFTPTLNISALKLIKSSMNMSEIIPNTISVLVTLTKFGRAIGIFVTNTDKSMRDTHKLRNGLCIFVADMHKDESSSIEFAVDLDKVTTKLYRVVTNFRAYGAHDLNAPQPRPFGAVAQLLQCGKLPS